jgi:hypothetical protein
MIANTPQRIKIPSYIPMNTNMYPSILLLDNQRPGWPNILAIG